jgi:hypothetical protein
MKRIPYVICLFILCSLGLFAQEPSASKTADYNTLVDKLKSGDTSIDFKALRIAYSQTRDYSPYGSDRDSQAAMFEAAKSKKYKDAIKEADKILKNNYVDMEAHITEAIAYRELGDTAKADLHKAIGNGLVNSVLNSGDGKSAKTAYVVISTGEEYTILRALGLRPASQSLDHIDGHTFDVMTGTNPKTNETVKIFFNIDIVWAAETKLFGK